ncbi:hypothetical protein B7H23_09175 [Notoacmeibacter marinus]|uniref:Uncharacterized protein n=1 Tax=Notoacmeibacter marinus TaxID=1876515 RepID=A0A231UWN5_9HYPH|nr:pyocin activator PrtN family protein [Notoacmeibacter marinus]OXT00310.1 hypothetical protein B7H23_09175 [Notoacmeibacter marinus]
MRFSTRFSKGSISTPPSTAFLLMPQHNDKSLIPLEEVRRNFISHPTLPKLLRELGSEEIGVPLVRIEECQKSATRIYLHVLTSNPDRRVKSQCPRRAFSARKRTGTKSSKPG